MHGFTRALLGKQVNHVAEILRSCLCEQTAGGKVIRTDFTQMEYSVAMEWVWRLSETGYSSGRKGVLLS